MIQNIQFRRLRYSCGAVSLFLAAILLLSACHRASPTQPPAESTLPAESDTAEVTTDDFIPVFVEPADSTLPCISIETAGGKAISSTTRYVDATLSITGAKYAHFNITLDTQIRGRGHSSFDGKAPMNSYDSKNSYRLKLTQKANLLGVEQLFQ